MFKTSSWFFKPFPSEKLFQTWEKVERTTLNNFSNHVSDFEALFQQEYVAQWPRVDWGMQVSKVVMHSVTYTRDFPLPDSGIPHILMFWGFFSLFESFKFLFIKKWHLSISCASGGGEMVSCVRMVWLCYSPVKPAPTRCSAHGT